MLDGLKRALLVVHRWTGFFLAAYVVVIGVTGSVLVFHDEIADTFRVPHVAPGGDRLPPDDIVQRIRVAYPGWHLQTLWWPEDAEHPWFAEVRRGPVGTIGETAFAVYVHPTTGEILLRHDYGWSVWRWMQLLHFNLLSGNDGRRINGMFALATLFSVLTGVLVWWPRSGSRAVWKIRWAAQSKRLIWELHQVTALYLLWFFLALGVTGAYFAWRAPFHDAIARFFPMQFMNTGVRPLDPVPAGPMRPLADFLPSVRQAVPDYPITRVLFPERPNQPVRFVVYEGTRREFFKASNLFFHPTTTELVRADLVRDRRSGDTIVSWIGAIHYGAFGGVVVKTIWAVAGLVFPFAAITGVIIWVNKRAGRNRGSSNRLA